LASKERYAMNSKSKRDFSLRKPTDSPERIEKKRRQLAPFEMTGLGSAAF